MKELLENVSGPNYSKVANGNENDVLAQGAAEVKEFRNLGELMGKGWEVYQDSTTNNM
jgi:hypothetical protein